MRLCRNKECRATLSRALPPWIRHCSVDCGTVLALANLERKKEADKKAWQRQANKAVKERKLESKRNRADKRRLKLESLSHQKDLTQRAFNKMIRLLDRGKICPTCGELLVEGMYDAGHVRTVASCPQIRYDARACFGQCRSCNGSGTIRRRVKKTQEVVSELYKVWIGATFGKEYYDWLYGPHESKHYTIDQLEALRKGFAAEARRLTNGEAPSRNWRALNGE